jgi:hypothetical protein
VRMRHMLRMRPRPFDDPVREAVVRGVVGLGVVMVEQPVDISVDPFDRRPVEETGARQDIPEVRAQQGVTCSPVDVAVPLRFVAQLLHGSEKLTLNRRRLSPRRHVRLPKLTSFLEVLHPRIVATPGRR